MTPWRDQNREKTGPGAFAKNGHVLTSRKSCIFSIWDQFWPLWGVPLGGPFWQGSCHSPAQWGGRIASRILPRSRNLLCMDFAEKSVNFSVFSSRISIDFFLTSHVWLGIDSALKPQWLQRLCHNVHGYNDITKRGGLAKQPESAARALLRRRERSDRDQPKARIKIRTFRSSFLLCRKVGDL